MFEVENYRSTYIKVKLWNYLLNTVNFCVIQFKKMFIDQTMGQYERHEWCFDMCLERLLKVLADHL